MDKTDRAYRIGEPVMTDADFDAEYPTACQGRVRKILEWPSTPTDCELKYDGCHVIARVDRGHIVSVFMEASKADISQTAKLSAGFHQKFGAWTGEIHGEALYPIAVYPGKTPEQRRAMAARHLLRGLPEAEGLAFVPWGWGLARLPWCSQTSTEQVPVHTALMLAGCPYDVDGLVLRLSAGRVAYKGPLFSAGRRGKWA